MKINEVTQVDEGVKDTLTNLAIAGAIGAGATGGMAAKQAASNYFNKADEPTKVVQQVKQQAPKIDTTKIQAKQQAQPVQQKFVKKIEVKPTTNRAVEKTLMDVALAHGIKGKELAAFMAQMKHESEHFGDMVEDKPNVKRYLKTKSLGNRNMTDAKRFIGRGFIQLTGRWNYKWMEKELGIDLTSTWSAAQKAADPKIAALIAVKFWKKRVRPNVQNFDDVKQVTTPINPNLNGLEDRVNNYKAYMQAAIQTQEPVA